MKLDPAVGLLATLFMVMVGATSISAFWGYSLGRQALSGVTQPDIRRTNEALQRDDVQSDIVRDRATLKSEDEILARVIARMDGSSTTNSVAIAPPEASEPAESQVQQVSDDDSTEVGSDVSLVTYQQQFPMSAENNQVVMAINSVQRQVDTVQIGVSLQNLGDRPVEFLYSLMDVLDESGQPLSVSTDGLPQEIPPTGETFVGSVTVPSVLIGTSNTLSLRLTDYPAQQVQLSINNIPVSQ
ncbi:MAG: hypothetical protein AAFQ57_17515 [Cyanobacteria bacterium J06626_14]